MYVRIFANYIRLSLTTSFRDINRLDKETLKIHIKEFKSPISGDKLFPISL